MTSEWFLAIFAFYRSKKYRIDQILWQFIPKIQFGDRKIQSLERKNPVMGQKNPVLGRKIQFLAEKSSSWQKTPGFGRTARAQTR